MKARRLVLTSAVLVAAILPIAGCGQMFRFIGDRVADAITQKTSSLADVSIGGSYITNLYPADAKTIETEMLATTWKPGGAMVAVNMLKRRGVGMWEIEGQVTARKGPKDPAVPMMYLGKGAYGLFLPPGDRAARTIEIKTATGESASFVLKPAAPLKIKAVNGKGAGATVDMAKDLVIDLEDPGSAGKLKVSMVSTVMGVRTMTDLAVCKPAKRLVVPAAAFRHLGVTASVGNFMGVDPGANYVLVERYEGGSIAKPGQAGAAYAIGKAWAHTLVNAVGDVKNAAPMHLEGGIDNRRGGLFYSIDKGQAFYAPPVARVRKLAVGSLRLRGVLFKANTSVSTSYGYNTITTTTTTTTYAFPKVAPAAWDRLLDDTAGGLGRAFGASMVPTERVVASPIYATLEEVKDEVSDQLVDRSYKKTRPVFASSLAGILGGVSSTFALDRPHVRLMQEVGADALLSANIDLQVGAFKDTAKVALAPALRFVLLGPPNGYTVGPTVYASGTVAARDGVTFSEAELSDLNALRRITRMDDLMAGLKGALGKLREEEKKQGYEAIWALQ